MDEVFSYTVVSRSGAHLVYPVSYYQTPVFPEMFDGPLHVVENTYDSETDGTQGR